MEENKNNQNTYLTDDENINKYFLKIAPDFSVFNYAEKVMLENNKTGEDGFFYFNESTQDIDTTFRRAMFRIDSESITITPGTNFSYRTFKVANSTILICISTMEEEIEFKLNSSYRVVGVVL